MDMACGLVSALPYAANTVRAFGAMMRARYTEHFSIGAVLEARAAETPDATAVLFDDQRWTYAEFNRWANRYAAVFSGQGIGSGSVVALLMENHPAVLAAVAGLVKLGAIAGMLNPNLRGDVLRHSVRTMKPARLLVASECLEQFKDLRGTWAGPAPYWVRGNGGAACPRHWTDLDAVAATASDRNPPTTGRVQTGQPCYYILTSGTTGMPKASVMTHRRWVYGMAAFGQVALRVGRDDVLYCALPLYHNNALTVAWSSALSGGGALALDRKFSASRFWERVKHYRATAFIYIGELCRYLLAQPPTPDERGHRLRACIGNGLRPEIWDAFRSRFGIERICEFYGASEGNLAFVNFFNMRATAGYCPYPFAVVAFDPVTAQPLRDKRGRLQRLRAGETGLLVTEVSKKVPFDGYTDSKSSESKLIRNAFKKGDCWFNSGDVVLNQGFSHIQFVDRLGDTFRWKGENVATTEVEGVLRLEPTVNDCAVYGVAVPNADGRAGMAAVRLADGAAFDGAALAAHLLPRLPVYAVPQFVRLVEALTTTTTFKIQKQHLRDDGCDPQRVSDPLFIFNTAKTVYEPLTAERWQQLVDGRLRL
jgi:acyl-CoA synthetase (AMP-forming)/AMP-acid ligase II